MDFPLQLYLTEKRFSSAICGQTVQASGYQPDSGSTKDEEANWQTQEGCAASSWGLGVTQSYLIIHIDIDGIL